MIAVNSIMPHTRQLRINEARAIRTRMPEFAGKKLNLVLRDDRVITGVVEHIIGESVILRNMKQKNMTFAFEEIAEIYFDTLS